MEIFWSLVEVFRKSGLLLVELLPYVLGGVVLAELLKYTPWTRTIKRAVGNHSVFSIVIAGLLGIVSPLSTYGTIPIIIGLYGGGVPVASLLSFLAASSLMNPQLFIITWGGLGVEFALIRLAAVFLFSLLLGLIVTVFEKKFGEFGSHTIHDKLNRKTSGKEKNFKKFSMKDFLKGICGNLEYVGFYIVLGVVVSTALETFVPVSLLLKGNDYGNWVNIILAALISIPVYVCGGGVIPLINMLMENGLSAGAAMAFLIAGPGTRIAPLLALGSFLSKRMLGAYAAGLVLFSILLGTLLDRFFIF